MNEEIIYYKIGNEGIRLKTHKLVNKYDNRSR